MITSGATSQQLVLPTEAQLEEFRALCLSGRFTKKDLQAMMVREREYHEFLQGNSGWEWIPEVENPHAQLKSPSELGIVAAPINDVNDLLVRCADVIQKASDLKAELGFPDLKLCMERPDEIPEELRSSGKIVFTKATARNYDSEEKLVFYLWWFGCDKWCTGGNCNHNRWCVSDRHMSHCWDFDMVIGRRRELT